MMPESAISQIFVGGLRQRTHETRIFTTIRQPERMEADGIGGHTLNILKRYDISTVPSPERKKVSAVGGDKREGRHIPNTPECTISPRFGQPERNEGGGIGGDRSPNGIRAHLKTLNYFATIRLLPRSGPGGTDGSKGKVGIC